MILYSVVTTYQLLNVIVHKMKININKSAMLMVSEWILEKHPNIQELNKIFDKVIVFDASVRFRNGILQNQNNYYEKLFRSIDLDIFKFEEIHVGGANYSFGIFLVMNNIPFIFWEEAAGILSKPEVLEEIESRFSKEKVLLIKRLGLYDGTNKVIKHRVCNLAAQEKSELANVEDFNVVNALNNLSDFQKRIILNFFKVEQIIIDKNSVLILTQHFANLKILSFEDQILIYQLFVDYFFPNEKIIFKPHPDDLMYYSILFPKSKVIRERFPSEIMPVIFNESPKIVATISSKAINNIRNIYNTFELNEQFEKDFYFLHRYYLSLRIANELKCSSVKMFGCNNVLIERLTHFVIKDNEVDLIPVSDFGTEKGLFIIDKAFNREEIIHFVENTDEDTVVIFINSQENYCFYDINHKDLWEYIIPKNIIKKCIKEEEFYSSLEEETVYVYSKNRRYRNMIQELEFNKKLENTGLEISVKSLTAEQLRIKVLEGILKATEERLLYYINLVKEFESNSK
mgnify:CR=1 FL=1